MDGAKVPLDSLAVGEETSLPEEIEEAHRVIRLLARVAVGYRDRLEQELKHRYGSQSEKQGRGKGCGAGSKPSASGAAAGTPAAGATPSGSTEADAETQGHGRRPIPAELPRLEVEVPLEGDHCLRCEGPLHRVERVESYRFDYVPGYIRVVVLVRYRCACNDPTCDGPLRIAKLPAEPIPKGRATAGFLAHLLVSKFADHCPLYRFRKILLRQKVDLPLSTLVDYCGKSTALLKPLWEVMRREVLSSAIIQTDDTHVRVRLPGKKGTLKGHLWAYKGDEQHRYVVFEFTPHWRGEAPQAFLATFKGYVQADAYKGYDALFTSGERTEVGCMAHARRKWIKAQVSSPQVAEQALEKIGRLYAIEDACKEMLPEQRKAVRQERAAPILEELRVWIAAQKLRVLPKSAVGEAIEYAENQWGALTRYLEDGRLAIDNNEVEQQLRAVALGRKNWLAAGSDAGGETAAIGYTMIASAVACGVEPVEWLTDVMTRIGTCPQDRLVELLPDRWKAARAEEHTARPEPHVVNEKSPVTTPAQANSLEPDVEKRDAPVYSPEPTLACASGARRPSDPANFALRSSSTRDPKRPAEPGTSGEQTKGRVGDQVAPAPGCSERAPP